MTCKSGSSHNLYFLQIQPYWLRPSILEVDSNPFSSGPLPLFSGSSESFFPSQLREGLIYLVVSSLSCSVRDLSLQHVGSSSLTRDRTTAPCIRCSES